jgi:hypothetical protein
MIIHYPLQIETSAKLNFTVDNHKNLKAVKGGDELVRKLKDLFSDFEDHEEKLRYCDNILRKSSTYCSIYTPTLNMTVKSFCS